MDKRILLEALITEREGMVAENTQRVTRGESLAFVMDHFESLADRMRVLANDTSKEECHALNNFVPLLHAAKAVLPYLSGPKFGGSLNTEFHPSGNLVIKNKPTHLVVATALRNAIKQVEEVHSDGV